MKDLISSNRGTSPFYIQISPVTSTVKQLKLLDEVKVNWGNMVEPGAKPISGYIHCSVRSCVYKLGRGTSFWISKKKATLQTVKYLD